MKDSDVMIKISITLAFLFPELISFLNTFSFLEPGNNADKSEFIYLFHAEEPNFVEVLHSCLSSKQFHFMCIEKLEDAGMEMRGVELQAPCSSGHFSWIMTLIILHLKERAKKEIKWFSTLFDGSQLCFFP